jgi:hypothetical protein
MIIWDGKTNRPPTPEDIKYIMAQFSKEVHDRGLLYGGSCELKEAKEV